MVNFGFNSASILGIFLALAGAGLYLLRSLRPEISRDHDIFFAAVGLLCGGILLWHGWRLDPILQFSQLLLAGSAIFFAVESVRLRGFTSQQARGKSSSSYVDEQRPVSRVYRAELEDQESDDYDYDYDYNYNEEQVPRRRLQGTVNRDRDKGVSSRRNNYNNSYEDDIPRSRSPRRYDNENDSERSSSRPGSRYDDEYASRRPNSRSTRPNPNSSSNRPSSRRWQNETDDWRDDDLTSSEARKYGSPKPQGSTRNAPRKRRPKSANDIVSNVGTEYVDYQPFDSENTAENDNPDQGDNNKDNDNYDY